ncbi:MAG: biotin carboxylase N-terminal domain-containing protein [Microscillaceae bacterium]
MMHPSPSSSENQEGILTGVQAHPQRPLTSVLIANRGEIASRIIRTCRKMGLRSVAVFSEADREAPFVREADFALYLGESAPSASYLHQERLIAFCQQYQISALHPGYGFLSENAVFAQKCREAGIVFIGPHTAAIAAMGSKAQARALAQAHGVPTVPGYQGEAQDLETLRHEAQRITYPVLLKAAAGGGGKGMRIVTGPDELAEAFEAARREAQNAFGDETLILEKYIAAGRHIEFQIFGDQHRQVVHLLERECTIQRRYQKIVEESPSPALDETLREEMGEAALKIARALHYDNAGTVEFILDTQTKAFYFLEVNTRLQVEHPVTEEILGLDLVQLQIEVAEGQALPFTQADIQGRGYAVECRLYAEDAQKDFRPATGKILSWHIPPVEGLRIETAVESGSEISIYYDPMIAKLIVWDKNRIAAHRKMHYVLQNLCCLGLTTNQDFLVKLFEHPQFQQGNYTTHFLGKDFDFSHIEPNPKMLHLAAMAATLFDWQARQHTRSLLKHLPSGWRNNFYEPQQEKYWTGSGEIAVKYRFLQNQSFEFNLQAQDYTVQLLDIEPGAVAFMVAEPRYFFYLAKNEQNQYFLRNEQLGGATLTLQERFPEKIIEKAKGSYEAPMPSQVVKVLVAVGQKVKPGQGLLVLSSMKMENTLSAQEEGEVVEIYVQPGQNVETGRLLLKLENITNAE